MSNRWVRFVLAVVAIVAAAGAAYRILQNEQRLANDVAAMRSAVFAGETAISAVEELKAALHAYVAPGQGLAFWATRAGLLLDKVRSTLLELDSVATAHGASLAESLDTSDRLAAAEQRARDHMRNGQPLLAGEVIFTEARDLLDGLRIQIARVRSQIATAASARQAGIRREQTWLAGAAAGILAFVLLLLVPPGRGLEVRTPSSTVDDRSETVPNASNRSDAPEIVNEPSSDLASLCDALAAVKDSRQIGDLLDGAARLLNAKGVIVWLSSPDRNELHAVASAGYAERVMSRIGPIHREEGNLTAAAFRDNQARTSAPTVSAAAALAVPLPSPDGPAGVFSVELRPDAVVQEGSLATARIVAAQLGALLGSIPTDRSETPSQAKG